MDGSPKSDGVAADMSVLLPGQSSSNRSVSAATMYTSGLVDCRGRFSELRAGRIEYNKGMIDVCNGEISRRAGRPLDSFR